MFQNSSKITKKSPLFEEHKKHKAKFISIAEWTMPISFRGIVPEHITVKKYAGIVDLSNAGKFFIKGEKAEDFLNFLMPQSIDKMANNTILEGQFVTQDGTILDKVSVYKISKKEFLILISSFRITVLQQWLDKHNADFDIEIENITEDYSIIELLGKNADEIIQKVFSNNFEMENNFFKKTKIANEEVFLGKYSHCKENGYQIVAKNNKIVKIWHFLLKMGKNFNLEPIGFGVCDILRIEHGVPIFPNEINESITPIEASVQNIDTDKRNYLGQEKIVSQIKNGTKKHLIGLELPDMTIISLGTPIFFNKKPIGIVTSCNLSPVSRRAFGLGYVVIEIDKDIPVEISFNQKSYNAKIVNLPFIKEEG